MEELKKLLISKPLVKEVYINSKGEWLFHSRPGFELKTREEILGLEKVEEEKVIVKSNSKKK